MGLAAGLVPCAATDDHPVVVDSDLPGIEVDGRPLETTDLAAPNPGRQFAQTFSRPTVEGSSSQILEGIAEQARGGRIIELLIMWRWANYTKVIEMKGFPCSLQNSSSEFIDQNFTLDRPMPRLTLSDDRHIFVVPDGRRGSHDCLCATGC
jgi:hypothetical protein